MTAPADADAATDDRFRRRLSVTEWLERELAKAPALSVDQTAMLRRVKRDLIRSANERDG